MSAFPGSEKDNSAHTGCGRPISCSCYMESSDTHHHLAGTWLQSARIRPCRKNKTKSMLWYEKQLS